MQDASFCVYKYTNTIDGKVYIGQTRKTLEQRSGSNGCNYFGSRHFFRAIKKYGWDVFVPEVLKDGLTQSEADELERYYISYFDSQNPERGYNITEGGFAPTVSDETRQIISEKAKERYKDPTKNPMYGKHHTEEAKQIIREHGRLRCGEKNAQYGKKYSAERRKQMSDIMHKIMAEEPEKYARIREANREVMLGSKYAAKKVRRIEDGTVWESCSDACKDLGMNPSKLSEHLHGKADSCKGFHFEFVKNSQTTIESDE